MTTDLIHSLMLTRIWFMKHILLASYWDWDATLELLKYSPPNKMYLLWNAHLLLLVGSIYPVILTIHLVGLAVFHLDELFGNSNTGRFTMFVLGIAEDALVIIIISIGIWQRSGRYEHITLINQLSLHINKLTDRYLKTTSYTNGLLKINQFCDQIAVLLFFLCLIGPVLAVFLVCLEFDETHHLIKEYLEIDLAIDFQNLPFLLVIYWAANNAASVCFAVVLVGLLYLKSVIIWMRGLKPVQITLNGNNYTLRTSEYGVLTENQFLHVWRSHQVINRILNEALASNYISAHHILCLVIFVGASFIFIRMPDKILQGGISTLAIFVLGSLIQVFIIYIESTELGKIIDGSSNMLSFIYGKTRRRNWFNKVMRSCQPMEVQAAYPFYTISRDTFPEFVDEGVNFIFTLISI